jgi:methionyl-tRNA formyltransferase
VVESIVIPVGKTISEVEQLAEQSKVDLQRVEDVNSRSFSAEQARLEPNLFVVAGFSKIFQPHLFQIPRLGTVNLHGGRVPQYRGGSPLNWQIINGEDVIGISALRMDAGIDTGAVLAETTFPLEATDDIGTVHVKANRLFGELTIEAIDQLEKDPDSGRAQNDLDGYYWHQRNDNDGEICFRSMTAAQVERFVRGVTRPYPGAYSWSDKMRVRIFGCEISEFRLRGNPGRVCWISGRGPYVICSNGAIRVTDYVFPDAPLARLVHGDVLGV